MMELTKERIEQFIKSPLDNGLTRGEQMEIARQLLASMEQEPVAYMQIDGDEIEYNGHNEFSGGGKGVPLYSAPQLPQPAVVDERAAFNAWNNEDNLPIAGVGAKNAAWLAWQARAVLYGNSVLDVPPERPADSSSGDDVEAWFDEGWNACRAAMLQGAEPVSQPYTLSDGWVAVPSEPTQEMLNAWLSEIANWRGHVAGYKAMLAAAPDFREISNSSTKHFRENKETSTNCPHCGRKPLKNRKCSVAGCEGRHVAHGLCQKHYDIEHKNNLSRRKNIRAANKRYRARRSAAPQQEVKP